MSMSLLCTAMIAMLAKPGADMPDHAARNTANPCSFLLAG
jgi:hypothetical protein